MRGRILLLVAVAVVAVLVGPGQALAAPLYDIKATWGDTNLPPGAEGQFVLQVRNIGTENGKGPLFIEDQLPEGVTATGLAMPYGSVGELLKKGVKCSVVAETVNCEMSEFLVSEFNGHGLAQAPGTKKENGLGIAGFGGQQPSGYMPTLFVNVAIDAEASGEGVNKATVSGGGSTAPVSDIDQVPFSPTPSKFGVTPGSFRPDFFDAVYPFGSPARQAGDHPFEQRIPFDFNARLLQGGDGTPFINSQGQLKTAEVTLPRGLIGNPEATPKCDPIDFAQEGSTKNSTACPANTQIGYLNGAMVAGPSNYGLADFFNTGEFLAHIAIYNLKPPKGVPADLAFNAGGAVQAHIYPSLDPGQNYAIKTTTPDISSLVTVRGSDVTIWGVPGDPAHDRFRYYPQVQGNGDVAGAPFGGAPIRPFLTNPMDCGFDNGGGLIRIDSYQRPGQFSQAEESPDPLNTTGCDDPRFHFEPDISLQPTDRHAGAPTGLDVHLEVPQQNDEATDVKELYAQNHYVKGISTPPIKKVVVTFPPGMTLSPSAAQGLGTCTSAQISLDTDDPVRCPDNSQYGKLVLHTPVFPKDAQPEGFIYIAKQGDNPYGNFLSFYMVIQEPERGILVKVPFKAELDPVTGQITGTLDELPQFPVSDVQMTFKGGVRAGLVEPSTCGTKTITAEFFSWQDPATPHPVESSYDVTEKPDGSPCARSLGERPFRPQLEAGTSSNAAGAYSPFALRLTRSDDDQEFSRLGMKLPVGLIGKLAGIGRCTDAGIARAASRTAAGDGGLEERDPSCPASSLIGTTDVGAGVGVPLTYVPGKIYMAGPYLGAPLSVVVISPAVVGPYDLGVIAVRTAVTVDPETARVSVLSDPFPQIFQGIPVRIRDVRVRLNRPGFFLNPTSCAEKQIQAHVTGTGGDVNSIADDSAADLENRFQAADCASLGFKPKLSFRLSGASHRGAHPALKAVVKGRPGDANIAAASVALPHSEFLDQAHIKTVCTRVQFAAKQCPAASVYGHVTAKSPLFDETFSGPVYLRSSSHPLPDLVAVLRGPASLPVEIDLDGRVDSINGGIRNTFEVVPDAPVTSFTLTMQGGKKGLLVNSTNLCADTHRATAKFKGQNGKAATLHPELRISCPAQARKPGRKGR